MADVEGRSKGRMREQVLAEFMRRISADGRVPRLIEVGEALGIHLVTVAAHLERLEEEGRIIRRDGRFSIPAMQGVDWAAVNAAAKSAAMKSRKQGRLSQAARIELVVARARQREQMGEDPFHERGGLFRNGRVRGSKV